MNERIRELAKQSGLWFVTPREDLIDDFAELIVQECIDCLTPLSLSLTPLSRSHSMVGAAQDTIKEHFGVE